MDDDAGPPLLAVDPDETFDILDDYEVWAIFFEEGKTCVRDSTRKITLKRQKNKVDR